MEIFWGVLLGLGVAFGSAWLYERATRLVSEIYAQWETRK